MNVWQRMSNPMGESDRQRYYRLLREYDDGMAQAESAAAEGYEEEAAERRRQAKMSLHDAERLYDRIVRYDFETPTSMRGPRRP